MAVTAKVNVGQSTWGSTCLTARMRELAAELARQDGGGARGKTTAAYDLVLARYEEVVRHLDPHDWPCFVGSLFGWPGGLKAGTRVSYKDDYGRVRYRREGEVLQPGSVRIFLQPPLRDRIERLTPYGAVFDGRPASSIAAGVTIPPGNEPAGRSARAGRPLTDVLMTAVVLTTGPLDDAPVAGLTPQTLPQGVAHALWRLASSEVGELPPRQRSHAIHALMKVHLPVILADGTSPASRLRSTLAGQPATLAELVAGLQSPLPDQETVRMTPGEQLSLFEEGD